tara:strand:- start:11605 stop:12438 length:834 start_codon:yes stop_codon:yes gene_type:complete
MKIALGSVQWGLDYGISNKKGIPSEDELSRILSFAYKSGIKLLDTASAYGDAETRIGNMPNANFKIVTKIGLLNREENIKNQIKLSLERLKLKSVYGCLFHDAKKLINNPIIWEDLNEAKYQGKINKIGYSLYHPEELDQLFDLNFIPDIVQLPYNIIDRRFEVYFERLNDLNVEIHVRSVFLQGLLLNFNLMKNSKFLKWKLLWQLYHDWLKSNKLSPVEGCLGHVLTVKEISKIVVGIEHINQLKEIINATNKNKIQAPAKLKSRDLELVNPNLW